MKNGETFIHENQKYVKVGNKAIPFEDTDENGKPIIRTTSTITKHPDGRQDVTIHVPCLQIAGETRKVEIL